MPKDVHTLASGTVALRREVPTLSPVDHVTETEPPPAPKPRRTLWLVALALVGLLALTTWDALRNVRGNSPAALRRAAFDGDDAAVRRLIKAHPEWIDVRGSAKRSPKRGSDSLWEITLIAFGKPAPSPNSREALREDEFMGLEEQGATPLVHAATQNHTNIAQILLNAGASVKNGHLLDDGLVMHALYQGDANLLAALEGRGAIHHALATHQEYKLLHAAVEGGQTEMVKFVLTRCCPTNGFNWISVTALPIAIDSHRLDLVQLLATNGADLRLLPAYNKTALEFARIVTASRPSSNGTAIVAWLEAFTATNRPPAKPAP